MKTSLRRIRKRNSIIDVTRRVKNPILLDDIYKNLSRLHTDANSRIILKYYETLCRMSDELFEKHMLTFFLETLSRVGVSNADSSVIDMCIPMLDPNNAQDTLVKVVAMTTRAVGFFER